MTYMKQRIEKVKDFLVDSTTISNRELVLAIAVGVLGGMVFGLLTSPRKFVTIGSHNGNNSPCDNGFDWEDFEDDEEEDEE